MNLMTRGGRARGRRPCSNHFVEPNPSRLQNRQAVVAPRLVGSTPAPLRSRTPCKRPIYGGIGRPPGSLPPCRSGRPEAVRPWRSLVDLCGALRRRSGPWLSRFRDVWPDGGGAAPSIRGLLESAIGSMRGAIGAQSECPRLALRARRPNRQDQHPPPELAVAQQIKPTLDLGAQPPHGSLGSRVRSTRRDPAPAPHPAPPNDPGHRTPPPLSQKPQVATGYPPLPLEPGRRGTPSCIPRA
jgi:hypothetical protein